MAGSCNFCSIVAVTAPGYIVDEDDRTVAFLDRGQATDGHTLVVPRAHAADIWEISVPDLLAVTAMAKRIAKRIDERLVPDGVNLTQSNRAAAGQEVFHFHMHVIPRWSNDGLRAPWGGTSPTEDQLAAILARLR